MGQGEKDNRGMSIVDPIQGTEGRNKKYLILVEYRYAFIKANVKKLKHEQKRDRNFKQKLFPICVVWRCFESHTKWLIALSKLFCVI